MSTPTNLYMMALQKLGFRQRAYQATFGEGSPGHLTLVDLAVYAAAFVPDTEGLSAGQLREMHGRRQVFFRIYNHLKLAPTELEAVYRSALLRAASRLQSSQGAEE